PEGGLTRDGALRSPKVGLLDALLQLSAEPGFDRDLLFVPVGINYDRVLEDEALLAEKRGREQPPGAAEKLRGALRLLWIVPSRARLAERVRDLRGELEALGAPTALGEEFESQREGRARLLEREDRNRDLARVEADVLALEEAEEIVRIGIERLARRRILVSSGSAVRVGAHPNALELLEYYARSLAALEATSAVQAL